MPKYRQISWVGNGYGFAPTWLCQVSPLLHMTTLTTDWSLDHLQWRRSHNDFR